MSRTSATIARRVCAPHVAMRPTRASTQAHVAILKANLAAVALTTPHLATTAGCKKIQREQNSTERTVHAEIPTAHKPASKDLVYAWTLQAPPPIRAPVSSILPFAITRTTAKTAYASATRTSHPRRHLVSCVQYTNSSEPETTGRTAKGEGRMRIVNVVSRLSSEARNGLFSAESRKFGVCVNANCGTACKGRMD